MSDRCPQDGGFVGECGCTHPNHRHSELVEGLLDAKRAPALISSADFDAAIEEGFYAVSPSGRVGFGKRLLNDWQNGKHGKKDVDGRKSRLAFAVATVREPDATERDHRGFKGRIAYTKAFEDFGIVVISDPTDHNYATAFTYIPKRKGKGGAK